MFNFRTHFPNKDIYFPLEPIEAECRATGMPVPTIEWVHGTGSFNVSFLSKLICSVFDKINYFHLQNDDFETNTIMDKSPTGLGEVVAKLIVHPHHIPSSGSKRTYTCVAKSGGKIVKASTTVHFNQRAGEQPHLNSNDMIKALTGNDKVQIYEYLDSLFEEIGSSVYLPCKATNNAAVFWVDNKGKQITGQDSRFVGII